MKRLEHPTYSQDLAPFDFILFGCLKKLIEGYSFSSENKLFECVFSEMNSIPQINFRKVYDEWNVDIKKVIDTNGKYII